MDERFLDCDLISSQGYAGTMSEVVLPYLDARKTECEARGADGVRLYALKYRADKNEFGTVFIVHGFTENTVKYSEIVYSLLKNGFDVVIYDQRGHGRSERDGAITDLSLTHVNRFEDYVSDLDCVVKAADDMPKPFKLMCHSMGGAVSALYLSEHTDVFERALMCAPMIAVNRRGMPFFTSKLICRAFKPRGGGRRRVFFSKPYADKETFEGACATGEERFEWYSRQKHTHPELQNNGASYSWMFESLKVSQTLFMPGRIGKISCPVRVYSAEDDWEVLNGAQAMFVKRLPKGELIKTHGTRHEIYRSYDEALLNWWRDALEFLKA